MLCFIEKNTIVKLLEVNIYDKTLFSLLHKIFKVKNFSKIKKAFYPAYNNILSLFLSQIYLTPLDNYARNLSNVYSTDKTFYKKDVSDKLTTLIKKNISLPFQQSLSIRL